MQIEKVDIQTVIPYEFNNRKHNETQINRIANSIKEFGYNQPIVVDEDNIILVGHGRLHASLKIKLKEVPIVRKIGLTDSQKKAYRILDNKLQNDSEWDFDNVNLELDFLEDDGFDLKEWGLDELRLGGEDDEVVEDDFEETEQTEIYIKLGDLIELGRHRVLCGDSTNSEHVEKLLNGHVPTIMVTDPPYGVSLDQSWRDEALGDKKLGKGNKNKVSNDDRADWKEAYLNFKGDVAYVWHRDRYAKLFAQTLEDSGFEICQQLIWNKSVMVMGRCDYHFKHEPCWYVVRKGKNHNWIGDRSQTTVIEAASPNHIMSGSKEDRTSHPTQKPVECMAYLIRNHSGNVYDPFLGSGTTLIACEQLNRTCYGMEIEPKYCQVIINRYYKYCKDNKKPFVCKINGQDYKPVNVD